MWVHLDVKYVDGMFTCIFFLKIYHLIFHFFYIFICNWECKHGKLGQTSLIIYYVCFIINFFLK